MLRIGELAQAAECETQTVRYYESVGLMPPAARTGSNYRRYGAPHVERLRFIRHCRAMGLGLDEIRTLLDHRDHPAQACDRINHLLDEHLRAVRSQIDGLLELEQHLKSLRKQCGEERSAADCGILSGLSAAAAATEHAPSPGT